MRQFLPLNHPIFKNDDEIKHEFSLSTEEPTLITLQLKPNAPGTWLTSERIQQLKAATAETSATEGVRTAISLGNIETAVSSPKGIEVGNLLALTPPDQWRPRVASDSLLQPGLISADQRTVMIVGTPESLSADGMLKMIDSLRLKLARRFPDSGEVKPLVGGVLTLQSDMTVLIRKELLRFLVLGLLAAIITLLAYFRGFSTVLSCLFLGALSNLGALSWMALAGLPFSVLSTTVPVLASIMALAIGSHTLLNFGNRWEAEKAKGVEPDRIQILREIYGGLFLPNFLTALTTTIGFATLATSQVPLIKQFAWSVGGGIMFGWLSVSLALPPLMYLMPIPRARKWTSASAKWALGVIRFRQAFFAAVVITVIAIGLHGVRLNWSVRLFDDVPSVGSLKASTSLIDQELGGMIPLSLMVREHGEPSPWNDPARVEKLHELLLKWRTNPIVGSAIGIPDFASAGKPSLKDATRKSLAETFFLLSFSESNPLLQFLSADGNSTRLELRLRDVPADQMNAAVRSIEDDAKTAFPGADVLSGGLASNVHILNAELSQQLITGLWQSLIWISLLMVVVFRSIRLALIAAVPNLLAPLALITTMALLKTPIKPTIAVVFSIALGVAYNNTVYLMSRLNSLRQKTSSPMSCIRKAWYQEGNPCLFSSLALFGGFAVFLSSYFALNRTFGAYMLWSIGVGLFGDLIFLPALLGLFPNLLVARIPLRIPARAPTKESLVYKSLIVLIIVLATLGSASSSLAGVNTPGSAPADAILQDVAKNLHTSDEQARIKMTIIEANGSKKERDLEISRLEERDGQSVLVRLQSPADLRGMGLLSVSHGGQTDQWLYLPSSKQTRRILSGKKSSNFLDSELSYEDMGNSNPDQITSQILRTETAPDGKGKNAVIESKLNNPDSAYSRIITWVDLDTKLVSKIEDYDRAGALLKTTEMTHYKKFTNGVWRAQQVLVTNAQNHRATQLDLVDLKLNRGLSSRNFSPSALSSP
ncbi:MAG: outer membrane lipoprotein-sorting protein [Oligoflexia bacterium]|nr:outer membrane lipoprotein-sorting protein [Oligoflexia bacterium]